MQRQYFTESGGGGGGGRGREATRRNNGKTVQAREVRQPGEQVVVVEAVVIDSRRSEACVVGAVRRSQGRSVGRLGNWWLS
jgi:hypothetical protein